MTLLLANLSEPTLHRSVKPQILSAFGDMALSIGSEFVKYLNVVLDMLNAASRLQVDQNSYDMMEYLNELRESVLEAYTGIIQGLKGLEQQPHPDVFHLESHLPNITAFIKRIAVEGDISDSMVASAAGFIGDLCTAFGPRLYPLLEDGTISQFLADGKRSKAARTKSLCNWPRRKLRNYAMAKEFLSKIILGQIK
ncbi:unnamed protein product [Ceratitis capitata]|uniref:(Mediterranean fruit fly) hypothetical protein n=1 Tax=Ceratitis capitata TaxID=7213 RepID=A0A811UDN3_CERCA|nr:unnamed protein product [Ceratitis capitata]